jgi:hypothetical protein
VSAADIDGWRAHELMAPLFMGDDEELQALIRYHLILPYLFGDFHPSHTQEYAGGLLIALEKPASPDGSPGGLRPIICDESWRRCLANLAAAAVWGPISKIFTSTKFFCRQQVSRMAPPTVPRFFPPCKASCDYACGLKEGQY